jgi:hypothetical protein
MKDELRKIKIKFFADNARPYNFSVVADCFTQWDKFVREKIPLKDENYQKLLNKLFACFKDMIESLESAPEIYPRNIYSDAIHTFEKIKKDRKKGKMLPNRCKTFYWALKKHLKEKFNVSEICNEQNIISTDQ